MSKIIFSNSKDSELILHILISYIGSRIFKNFWSMSIAKAFASDNKSVKAL